ncbi:flagellar basal body P-ring formation protein FlgA [Geobacter sp. FeAm09]|uniref:flagellar basal body P-ring formation chaperone FlgA n=1 Tax=Geobacter sp. FeAm09 TaxID=2597769 RepID=UPI0011F03A2E|nr:flagellar basal body P-ring formation chaperone FlgA [Geobacter sp. FeAm09]QEM69865.1 flagellar basal body P-ring formation protein FlgA [Geobacter sp. FeAm09]
MIRRFIGIFLLCLLLAPPLATAAPARQEVSAGEARVHEAVSGYIREKTAHLGLEIRIKRISVNGNPSLPEGPLDFEVVAPQQWEGWGSANLAVVARQRDRVVLNIPVQVEVEALADMVVALRQLDYGTVITGADVTLQKRDVATVGSKYSRSLDSVVDRRARMPIKANAAIRTDQVEKVPLIKSGQMVTIVAENEVMKITVTGRARSAGAEGDTIMVQNLSSLKEIPAKVINATTVQVGF